VIYLRAEVFQGCWSDSYLNAQKHKVTGSRSLSRLGSTQHLTLKFREMKSEWKKVRSRQVTIEASPAPLPPNSVGHVPCCQTWWCRCQPCAVTLKSWAELPWQTLLQRLSTAVSQGVEYWPLRLPDLVKLKESEGN
jgi:hypothetical protein